MAEFRIGNHILGKGKPVFIVAEVSANHGQNLDVALEMIRKAKECGANAVKFQTYTPDTITLDVDNPHFQINHPKWGGQTLYNLYKSAYTPWEWFAQLKKACDERGIVFFSTAFDPTSVDFLEDLDVSVHKIASFELTDIPLIEYAARTKKPLIMSTGMASDEEIDDAVNAAKNAGAEDILLLKCVSSYPAKASEMNLRTITNFQKKYNCCVGFSDHTIGNTAAIAAVTLGAVFVEKHFILDKSVETPDSFFSINPDELRCLVEDIRTIEEGLGTSENTLNPQEQGSKDFRRSLFAVEDISEGEELTESNVRSVRPGMGLKPKHLKEVVGKVANKSIDKGTPLSWDLLK